MSKIISSITSSIPIWLKSVAFTILLLFSSISVIQLIIEFNVIFFPILPIGVIVIGVILLVFYLLLTGGLDEPKFREANKELVGITSMQRRSFVWVISLSFSLLIFSFALLFIGFGLLEEKETSQVRFIKLISESSSFTAISLLLTLALSASLIEEMLFRGFLQKVLMNNYGIKFSFFIVSLVFVIIHFLPAELIIPYFLISIGFCFLSYYSKSVIPCIIVHFVFNAIIFVTIYYLSENELISFIEDGMILNIVIAFTSLLFFVFSGYKLEKHIFKTHS